MNYNKKGSYQVLIEGQAAKELYETIVCVCTYKIRKVKALELILVRDLKDTKNPTGTLVAKVHVGHLEETS